MSSELRDWEKTWKENSLSSGSSTPREDTSSSGDSTPKRLSLAMEVHAASLLHEIKGLARSFLTLGVGQESAKSLSRGSSSKSVTDSVCTPGGDRTPRVSLGEFPGWALEQPLGDRPASTGEPAESPGVRAAVLLHTIERLAWRFIRMRADDDDDGKRSRRHRSCAYNCLNVDIAFDHQGFSNMQATTGDPVFSTVKLERSPDGAMRVVITNIPNDAPLHTRLTAVYEELVGMIRAIDTEAAAVQKELFWCMHQRKRAAKTLDERMMFEILYMFVEDIL